MARSSVGGIRIAPQMRIAATATRAISRRVVILGHRSGTFIASLSRGLRRAIEAVKLRLRGLMIRLLGRVTPDFTRFVAARDSLRHGTGPA